MNFLRFWPLHLTSLFLVALSVSASPVAFRSHNDEPEFGLHLDQLPSEILAIIMQPNIGLDRRQDLASLLSANKALSAVKSSLSRELLFYHSVASKYLAMHYQDGDIRVIQSFFRCAGGLSDDGKNALVHFIRYSYPLVDADMMDQGRLVEFCAKEVMHLVSSEVFQNVTSPSVINESIGIQFMYQSMDIPGAYERLLPLFNNLQSLSATARETLANHAKCHTLLSLLHDREAERHVDQYFERDALFAAGCLTHLKKPSVFSMYRRSFPETVEHVFDLYTVLRVKYAAAFTDYDKLLVEFDYPNFHVDSVPLFVDRGLLLNFVSITQGLNFLGMKDYLGIIVQNPVKTQALLAAGWDLSQHHLTKACFIDVGLWALRRGGKDRLMELLKSGLNINMRYRSNSTSVIYASRGRRHMDDFEEVKLLVDVGADIIAVDDSGMSGLSYWEAEEALPYVRYMVEHARPELNRRSANGETVLFSLVSRGSHPIILSYLFSKGLNISIMNTEGQNAAYRAKLIGNFPLGDWLAARPP